MTAPRLPAGPSAEAAVDEILALMRRAREEPHGVPPQLVGALMAFGGEQVTVLRAALLEASTATSLERVRELAEHALAVPPVRGPWAVLWDGGEARPPVPPEPPERAR